MAYNPDIHHRRSIRLRNDDAARIGGIIRNSVGCGSLCPPCNYHDLGMIHHPGRFHQGRHGDLPLQHLGITNNHAI
ncbi:MAG: hypothetical protein QTN59_06260 [Candidatus Electrothrix communis]|nr:MAG: hypothetical protein QTN59_06260 [Candidatus Electrothrix communis]